MLKDETIARLSVFTDSTSEIHGSNRSFSASEFDPYENSYILQSMSYAIMGYGMCHGNAGLEDFAKGLIDEIERLYPQLPTTYIHNSYT